MNERQANQFNNMLRVLRRIARDYQTADLLLKYGERDYGISGCEALEMAYDNIQQEARNAVFRVRPIECDS